jgi:molecular chaperone DnaK
MIAENNVGKLIVGEQARSYSHNCIREAKRDIGVDDYDRAKYRLPNHSLSPITCSALILKKLVSIVEDAYPGKKVKEAVITVPANFNDAEKNATKDAALLAGIDEVHLIAEPTAAYLAHGHQSDCEEDKVFVFDFGGGTLDISIVETIEAVAGSMGVGGDKYLGGKDIDEAFSKFIETQFLEAYPNAEISEQKRKVLNEKAEDAKIRLSTETSVHIYISNFASVDGNWLNLKQVISRSEFEESIGDILNKSKSCIRESLKTCGIKPSEIKTVLLVGGCTHIPSVREMVFSTFGSKETLKLDPDCAVAEGASIRHAMLNGQLDADKGLVLMDISRYGFGVETVDIVGGYLQQGKYSSLMEPQTHFPYEAIHEFSLIHPEQESVEISVYQSNSASTATIADAISTGVSGNIENIPHSKSGTPHMLQVTISVDENNLISVTSRIPDTGQVLPLIIDDYSNRLSGKQRVELEEKLSDIQYATFEKKNTTQAVNPEGEPFIGSVIGQESAPLVKKALGIIDNGNPEYSDRLSTLMSELVTALEKSDEITSALYRDKLTDLLFDIDEIAQ